MSVFRVQASLSVHSFRWRVGALSRLENVPKPGASCKPWTAELSPRGFRQFYAFFGGLTRVRTDHPGPIYAAQYTVSAELRGGPSEPPPEQPHGVAAVGQRKLWIQYR